MNTNLARIWGLSSDYRIQPIAEKVNSVWTITDAKGSYYLKVKPDLDKALNEIHLSNHLRSCGLPVLIPIPDKTGNQVPCIDGAFYCLYPEVQGKAIKGNNEISKHGYSFGFSLGLLHKALAGYAHTEKLSKMNLSSQLEDWIIKEIDKSLNELDHTRLTKVVSSLKDGINKIDCVLFQPIHRDPHAEHIFFINSKLTGIIDFELSVIGPRIFDPCYLSTSIITDYSGNAVDTSRWLKFLSDLFTGYHAANHLHRNELESVEHMLYMIELIFIAFWCSMGKFDYARTAEDSLYFLVENRDAIRNAVLMDAHIHL